MVHYSKVVRGFIDYIDSEFIARFQGSPIAWIIGAFAGIAASRAEDLFNLYKDNAMLNSLGVIKGEEIDVDIIYTELLKVAQKSKITIPVKLIGPVILTHDDVKKLYRCITDQ